MTSTAPTPKELSDRLEALRRSLRDGGKIGTESPENYELVSILNGVAGLEGGRATQNATPETEASLNDEELLRGFHVHNLMGGDGSIQFTQRTILRELPDGRFMLSEPEEMDLEPKNVFSGDKKVGTTDSNVIAIDTDEVKALVRKVHALEGQSIEGLREKVEKVLEEYALDIGIGAETAIRGAINSKPATEPR